MRNRNLAAAAILTLLPVSTLAAEPESSAPATPSLSLAAVQQAAESRLVLPTPRLAAAAVQQSEQRRSTEAKATFFLWTGIGVAAAGITPLMYGLPSMGVPLLAGGGALIYYAFHLNNQAKQLPSTMFGISPVRKGLKVGFSRSW